jgi:aryl-alcohol dehydrogenase-like predicted oxidoreductase
MDLVNLRLHSESGAASEPTPEQLGAMADLQREGKLDLIGVSNVTLDGVKMAYDLLGSLGEVQNAYSILDRSDDPVVDFCEEHGIAYVAYFPLGSAFAGGPKVLAADPAVAAVAEKHGATPSQIALAWLLQRSPRILLIPGTSSVSHLEENLAAGEITLDAEDMTRLDEVKPVTNPGGR